MSQIDDSKLPPVPPPPPQLLTLQEFKLNPKSLNPSPVSEIDENELDLLLRRFILRETKFCRTFYLANTRLKPQLQDGPKCGLVALSIATSCSKNFVEVEDIFKTAISYGFTKQGEMFSTDSLASLAEKSGFKTKIITGGLNTHLYCILISLLRKRLLLIPYDADFNHAPCCKNGSKAHWAVITGFVIFGQENADSNKDFVLINTSACSTLCQCMDGNNLPLTVFLHQEKLLIGKRTLNETYERFNEGKIYLIGMQGKSRHTALWSFDEMTDSNNNLMVYPDDKDFMYVFPEGGIEKGLKGKAIILDGSCLP